MTKEEYAKKRAELEKNKKEALEYVENFKKENGNNSFISIRIRNGYIGKELGLNKLQLVRSEPRGTMVAIKDGDKGVSIGWTYKAKEDDDVPIIGIAKALKEAVQGTDDKEPKNKNDKDLLEFFSTRAFCYFFPEEYSYSRGKNKLEYKNYDKIHENRARALRYIGREDLI